MNGTAVEGSVSAVVLMGGVTCLSVIGNGCISCVILRTAHLRRQFGHVLTLSLFFIDLLHAFFVLPVAIASYWRGAAVLGQNACRIHAALITCLTAASTATLSAISVDRCYSIQAPMHYSAHMNLQRTLGVITGVWMTAILVAMLPLFNISSYGYQASRSICSYSWTDSDGYVVLMALVAYILPAVVMIIMYSVIFRTARKTARQIGPCLPMHPVPTISRSLCPSPNSADLNSQSMFDSGCEISSGTLMSESKSVPLPESEITPAPLQDPGVRKGAWKAAKTLLSLTIVFFVFWSPLFVASILASRGSEVGRSAQMITTWLSFSSYALNPVLYGLLNRSIREALIDSFTDVASWTCKKAEDAAEDQPDEDFFQFLERTSVTQSQTLPVRTSSRVQVPPISRKISK